MPSSINYWEDQYKAQEILELYTGPFKTHFRFTKPSEEANYLWCAIAHGHKMDWLGLIEPTCPHEHDLLVNDSRKFGETLTQYSVIYFQPFQPTTNFMISGWSNAWGINLSNPDGPKLISEIIGHFYELV